jgi:hypothetical protein
MGSNHKTAIHARLARAGSKAGGSQRLTCGTARAVLWRRPADQAVLVRQACSSYSPFLCLSAPGLSLHIPKHRRGAGVYTLSWAGGIAQKLIAMLCYVPRRLYRHEARLARPSSAPPRHKGGGADGPMVAHIGPFAGCSTHNLFFRYSDPR